MYFYGVLRSAGATSFRAYCVRLNLDCRARKTSECFKTDLAADMLHQFSHNLHWFFFRFLRVFVSALGGVRWYPIFFLGVRSHDVIKLEYRRMEMQLVKKIPGVFWIHSFKDLHHEELTHSKLRDGQFFWFMWANFARRILESKALFTRWSMKKCSTRTWVSFDDLRLYM